MRPAVFGVAAAALLTAAASGPASAQISDDVVKIGILTDLSGLYSDNTGEGTVIAEKMAVEDFGGKVLGKPIEVVVGDHQNKADVAAALARKWIDEDHVDVITSVANSAVALAVQEVTREKNRILLNTGAATSDFTGKFCSPTGFGWTYDTYALAAGTGTALTKQGGDSWYFITADYAFGHALERDTTHFIEQAGGKVLGATRVPISTMDFSSAVLQAQGSGAKVVGLANAGADFINSMKQAGEFGIVKGGQRIAGMLVVINDINALGLEVAQGLVVTDFGYWDLNDETRAWNKRFQERHGKPANFIQINDYGAVTHYLKAVQAAGTDEAKAVAGKMRELPINDPVTKDGHIRADGRVLRNAYLVQVKSPAESKGPWDYYKILATIPPEQATRPLDQGGCPLVKG
ncbi:MAG: ABC transporter substrate-binding protein [Alphaproteobacteria bacterium]|nr:ABC transporter substrate-binding protein [Alphaproteobacteria bacterium]MBV9862481.1 ABC transporter substrate-binding protein [Alphaproteobacteria bacterium]